MPQAENMSELTVIQLLQDDGIQVSIDRGRRQLSYDEWFELRNRNNQESESVSYGRYRSNRESLYQPSFVHRGQRLIDVALMNQHINVRRRPHERCSYCLCRGHYILFCGVPEKMDVENYVNRFTNILDGNYKDTTPTSLRVILKHFLIGATLNPMDLPILMLYFVALGIKTPTSADKNRNYSIHKIIDEILRIRSKNIYRLGTDEQRSVIEEYRLEQEGNERTVRLKELLGLYNSYNEKLYTYYNYKFNVGNYNEISSIPFVNASLFNLRNEILCDYDFYKNGIEFFQRDFPDLVHPEILLFGEVLNEEVESVLTPYPFTYSDLTSTSVKISKQVLLPDEYESWTDIECPVCYETIEKDNVYMTNCAHKFCYDCITKTININKEKSCPCCRGTIVKLVNKSSTF